MSELEDLIAINISFAMQMWAEEKPKEKVGFKDFPKHFVERRNGILNLYTKRTLDEIEAYISKLYIKKDKVMELLERLELEFNVIICDCGEPYKDTDPHWVVKRFKEKLIKGEK